MAGTPKAFLLPPCGQAGPGAFSALVWPGLGWLATGRTPCAHGTLELDFLIIPCGPALSYSHPGSLLGPQRPSLWALGGHTCRVLPDSFPHVCIRVDITVFSHQGRG